MILEHYSAKSLGEVSPAAQHDLPDHKPQGLWLSVPGNDDWPTWCRDNDWRPEALKHVARFALAPGGNVLHLEGAAAIDHFHDKFALVSSSVVRDFFEIAWARVAERYDGIIIAPYQPARRLDRRVPWYYGWDCACACLWNPRSLIRTTHI